MSKKRSAKDDTKRIDKSKFVPQREKIQSELHIREKFELTAKQRAILEVALHKDTRCVFIDGIYGSGKSWLSVLAALKLLNQKRIDSILYVRNPVEASSTGKIGYLKGEMADKMAPYNAILTEKLDELLPAQEIEYLTKDGRVEGIPLGFVRGRSWTCKAVIADEAASMSYEDLVLLMSRCGEFTRLFVIGDSVNQNDIGSKSGFARMYNIFDDEESRSQGVFCFKLQERADIVRSKFVQFIMQKLKMI